MINMYLTVYGSFIWILEPIKYSSYQQDAMYRPYNFVDEMMYFCRLRYV